MPSIPYLIPIKCNCMYMYKFKLCLNRDPGTNGHAILVLDLCPFQCLFIPMVAGALIFGTTFFLSLASRSPSLMHDPLIHPDEAPPTGDPLVSPSTAVRAVGRG